MNYYYFSFSEATQTQDTLPRGGGGRSARENESFRHPTEAAGSDPTQPPLFLFASLSLYYSTRCNSLSAAARSGNGHVTYGRRPLCSQIGGLILKR